MDPSASHEQLHELTRAAELGVDASELHGLLVGYCCGGGRVRAHEALTQLGLKGGEDAAHEGLLDALDGLHAHCQEQLRDLNMGLELLLPVDARPLQERADALIAWIRGFLGGFGLAGVDAEHLSGDGRELLRDLATIAASRPTLESEADADADADEESAWMELVEFVRVGCMMVHAEMSAGRQSRSSHAPHA